jgi:hypothetical protein
MRSDGLESRSKFSYREDAGGDRGGSSTLGKDGGGGGKRAKHYVSMSVGVVCEGKKEGRKKGNE